MTSCVQGDLYDLYEDDYSDFSYLRHRLKSTPDLFYENANPEYFFQLDYNIVNGSTDCVFQCVRVAFYKLSQSEILSVMTDMGYSSEGFPANSSLLSSLMNNLARIYNDKGKSKIYKVEVKPLNSLTTDDIVFIPSGTEFITSSGEHKTANNGHAFLFDSFANNGNNNDIIIINGKSNMPKCNVNVRYVSSYGYHIYLGDR